MAAEHYEKAWRLLPARRTVLVDLGRMWQAQGRVENSRAALLAASRGGEARAAEMARELLPVRYPFVSEFRRALDLDPANTELRRELGYLLLRMGREDDAEQEFQKIAETAPDDLLSATQLGFLLYGRGERGAAMPLFERVMAGDDDDLANRVRAVLQLPQVVRTRAEAPGSIDARIMAERSIKAGYLKDAVRYLERAHEVDPRDPGVMLKLGWADNMLHEDGQAYRWFALARKSRDRRIAAEASAAWRNLRPANETFRTTVWLYPIYSTRWSDFFSYGQAKTEWRVRFPIHPYVSVRFIGDTTGALGTFNPIYLSESLVHCGGGRGHIRLARSRRLGGSRLGHGLPHPPHAARLPGWRLGSSRRGSSFTRRIAGMVRECDGGWRFREPFRQRFFGIRPSARGIYGGSGFGAQPALLEWEPDL